MEIEEEFILNILGKDVVCSIISDRYEGMYSDARVLAFALRMDDIPRQVWSEDCECESFWKQNGGHEKYIIGKGRSCIAAKKDLFDKITKHNFKVSRHG